MLKNLKKRFAKTLRAFLPLAATITLTFLVIYATVHQTYRQGANDPQVQMVEDAVTYLKDNELPPSIEAAPPVDMAKSLRPYLMIFDKKGKVVYSQASLNGKPTQPPAGVLESAKKSGENRVTWQPAAGVRSATVIKYYKGKYEGYVLAGRSLREVENRVDRLSMTLVLGWMGTLAVSFATFLIFSPK